MENLSQWLASVKRVLEVEGFYDPSLLQIWKEGQVFGLIKDLDNEMQIHVRGFKYGHLEAEIEPQRWYFEHLDGSYCRQAYVELSEILTKHGIPHLVKGVSVYRRELRRKHGPLTDWRPIATFAAFLFLIGLFVRFKDKEVNEKRQKK